VYPGPVSSRQPRPRKGFPSACASGARPHQPLDVYTHQFLDLLDVRFVLAASGPLADVSNPPQANKYAYWTSGGGRLVRMSILADRAEPPDPPGLTLKAG
jgi:hypothetical protein